MSEFSPPFSPSKLLAEIILIKNQNQNQKVEIIRNIDLLFSLPNTSDIQKLQGYFYLSELYEDNNEKKESIKQVARNNIVNNEVTEILKNTKEFSNQFIQFINNIIPHNPSTQDKSMEEKLILNDNRPQSITQYKEDSFSSDKINLIFLSKELKGKNLNLLKRHAFSKNENKEYFKNLLKEENITETKYKIYKIKDGPFLPFLIIYLFYQFNEVVVDGKYLEEISNECKESFDKIEPNSYIVIDAFEEKDNIITINNQCFVCKNEINDNGSHCELCEWLFSNEKILYCKEECKKKDKNHLDFHYQIYKYQTDEMKQKFLLKEDGKRINFIHTDFDTNNIKNSSLQNLGNTCYFNSGLKCIMQCDLFSRYILSKKYKYEMTENKETPLCEEYYNFLKNFSDKEKKEFPKSLKRKFSNIEKKFNNSKQHDSCEFIVDFLNAIGEETREIVIKSKDTSPQSPWKRYFASDRTVIKDLFYGMTNNIYECTCGCFKNKKMFDAFLAFSLPVSRMTFSCKVFSRKKDKDNKTIGTNIRNGIFYFQGPNLCVKQLKTCLLKDKDTDEEFHLCSNFLVIKINSGLSKNQIEKLNETENFIEDGAIILENNEEICIIENEENEKTISLYFEVYKSNKWWWQWWPFFKSCKTRDWEFSSYPKFITSDTEKKTFLKKNINNELESFEMNQNSETQMITPESEGVKEMFIMKKETNKIQFKSNEVEYLFKISIKQCLRFGLRNIKVKKECKNGHPINLKLNFVHLPLYLFIHLRRFDYDYKLDSFIKLSNSITNDESLDLKEYCEKDITGSTKYKLIAIDKHYGSSCDGGHYVSECLINNEWFLFNDGLKKKIDKESSSKDSLVLVYQREEVK